MAESYVQLPADGAGKKLHTFQNVIGANTVQDETVVLVTSAGVEKAVSLEATQLLAEAHLGTIDTSTAAAEVHTGNIETDLALVHTHIAGVETQCTEINAHVHDLDTDSATIVVQLQEINAHVHSLDAKDPSQTAYKFAYVNIQADGDLIALVAGKKIRVHGLVVHAIDTSTGMIKTDDAGGAVKLEFNLSAREGMVLPFSPAGWFETVSGEALFVDFVVGAETQFCIVYSEV